MPDITARMRAARDALAEVKAQDAALLAELARVNLQAASAANDSSAVGAIHQQRSGVFRRLLGMGRPLTEAGPELAQLDKQAATAAAKATDAHAVLTAAREVEAEINARRAALQDRASAAQRELQDAEIEGATIAFEQEAVPMFLEALGRMSEAASKYYGALLARTQMEAKRRAQIDGHMIFPEASVPKTLRLVVGGWDLEAEAKKHPRRCGIDIFNFHFVDLHLWGAIDDTAALHREILDSTFIKQPRMQ
jgi:hypothetical protein